jgi:hypothetical protein
MGPKKDTTQKKNPLPADADAEEECSVMDMLKSMNAQLTGLTTKMERIKVIETEVKNLRVLMTDLKNENKKLKAEALDNERKFAELNEKNISLENRLNSLEQHHRSWSARILNVPLSSDDEKDNVKVRDTVYNVALLPILKGAVSKNLLRELPTAEQLLEVCHVLPGKPGQPKPIILRFYNRNVRDACFRMRKYFAPREETNGAGGGGARGGAGTPGSSGRRGSGDSVEGGEGAGGHEGRGRFLYPLYEDLSRATFLKMRAISQDSRVKSCWTVKGQIRFILHSKVSEIKRVGSLLDPLDTILQ